MNTNESCLNCENMDICTFHGFIECNSQTISRVFISKDPETDNSNVELFAYLAARCRRFDKIEE